MHAERLPSHWGSVEFPLLGAAIVEGDKIAGQYSAMTEYGLIMGRNTDTLVSHA